MSAFTYLELESNQQLLMRASDCECPREAFLIWDRQNEARARCHASGTTEKGKRDAEEGLGVESFQKTVGNSFPQGRRKERIRQQTCLEKLNKWKMKSRRCCWLFTDFQYCLVFTLFLSRLWDREQRGNVRLLLPVNKCTNREFSLSPVLKLPHSCSAGGSPRLPFSEFSADDEGLVSSWVCRLLISAFLLSTSCWRLLISTCGGRGGGTDEFGTNMWLTGEAHVLSATEERDRWLSSLFHPPVCMMRRIKWELSCSTSQKLSGKAFGLF